MRDLLMKGPSKDLDFAFAGHAEALAKGLAQELPGSFVVLDDVQKIYRVVVQESSGPFYLDISACQGKTIEEDLARRDFTANAMALRLNAERRTQNAELNIIDPFNGRKDIKNQIVRQVSSKIYEDDPLRLLRAFRFMAQWEATIEPKTLAAIKSQAVMIKNCSGERIREELFKLFGARESHKAIRLMDKAGLLTQIFPELEKSRGLALDYYPKIGVLGHVLNSLERLEDIFADYPKRFPKIASQLKTYFAEKTAGQYPRWALMKLAALLHDVAKPATAQVIKGRTRFFGHDEVGQGMAQELLTSYRFSNKEVASVSRLVRAHMRPGNLAHAENLTDKAIYRFFRDLEDDAIAMLIISLADHQTYLKPKDYYNAKDPHVGLTKKMLKRYFLEQEKVKPQKLLDGTMVMKELDIPASPLVGEILQAIQEAQAEGKIKNQTQALEFAKAYLKSKM